MNRKSAGVVVAGAALALGASFSLGHGASVGSAPVVPQTRTATLPTYESVMDTCIERHLGFDFCVDHSADVVADGHATMPPVSPHTVPRPMATVLTTNVPDGKCHEDEPCWDCNTMGNRICGPGGGH